MFLFVAATAKELETLSLDRQLAERITTLVCGVGPVEAAWRLTDYLVRQLGQVSGVVNFGLAGAYPDREVKLLDLCLAEREFLGDLGVVLDEGIAPLDPGFAPPGNFDCDRSMLGKAATILTGAGYGCRLGNFVTVSGASGTVKRSRHLRDKYSAICENMEGAALARVCQVYALPFLELRCVSNLVVERPNQQWRAAEAAARCGEALTVLAKGICGED